MRWVAVSAGVGVALAILFVGALLPLPDAAMWGGLLLFLGGGFLVGSVAGAMVPGDHRAGIVAGGLAGLIAGLALVAVGWGTATYALPRARGSPLYSINYLVATGPLRPSTVARHGNVLVLALLALCGVAWAIEAAVAGGAAAAGQTAGRRPGE